MGLCADRLPAEVVRIEIRQREPFAEGQLFPPTGAYEKISGRLYLEVDPQSSANAGITDLKLAPRNASGRVEFWSDFCLIAPRDPLRGNGAVLYDVNNRGNKLALWTFNGAPGNNPKTRADAGNGFLMRQGFSVLWCGWNAEVQPGAERLLLGVPVARQPDGTPITGRILVEICRDEPVPSSPFYWTPWAIAEPYPPLSLDSQRARLTARPTRDEAAQEIPPSQWAFAREENGRRVPDPGAIWVEGGLRPGWLYDLLYEAREPRLMGLGFAAVRDCLAFFRYAQADRLGTRNPLASAIRRAHLFGISQSGRFVNHFLYGGFNVDERGRKVIEGAFAHVPGSGRGLFNHRFGVATICSTQHEQNLTPCDSFPFAPIIQTDPVTGRTGDGLAGARRSGYLPRVFYTQSATEYWTRAASLLHTDVEGRHDLALDSSARLYMVAGAQHLGGSPPERTRWQNRNNPLDDRGPVLRALLLALDRWVAEGVPPPPSRYPRIADGTLVDVPAYRKAFPKIPGVNLPQGLHAPRRLDFGPRWEAQGIADWVPPRVGPAYRTLVPAPDKDGNDRAGIRLPDVEVPRATYTGWNLRAKDCGAEGMLAPYNGSYFPLARSAAERSSSHDPRLSIGERYANPGAYLDQVRHAAARLQADRFLLPEDAAAIVTAAAARE